MTFRILLLLSVLLSPRPLLAQTRAEELLRLVPDDAGFCLVINDLRGASQKLMESAWLKTLLQSPLGRALRAAPEFAKLQKINQDLKEHLQVGWPVLRDEILGDAVVFAYRPPAAGAPQTEQGLFLLRAPNARLLADIVERFQKLQKETGELRQVTTLEHMGVPYFRRVDHKGVHYYYLHAGLLAFSPRESLIQTVIERTKTAGSSRLAEQMQRAAAGAFVALCVNPRAFDEELERKPQDAPTTAFRRCWRALDSIVLACKAGNDSELTTTFQGRTADLPLAARQVIEQLTSPSELWTCFPEHAILRAAGRIDVAALVQALGEFAPPNERQAALAGLQKTLGAALGLDVLQDLLPSLGPDMGICVVPANEPSRLPYVIAAIAIKEGEKQVDRVVFQSLASAAWLGMVNYNMQHDDKIVMRTRVQEGVEVRHFSNDKGFPAGFEPAIALKDGYLLIASHPDALGMFRKGAAPVPAEPAVLRLSLTRLADHLRIRRDDLARLLMAKRGIAEPAVAAMLDTLVSGLEPFDEVSIGQRNQPGQVAWTLRLKAKVH